MSKKSLRIVVLSSDFKPNVGGIAELAYQICKELAFRGHQVTVLTIRINGYPNRETTSGFEVRRVFNLPERIYSLRGLLLRPSWAVRTHASIVREIAAVRPDVLLCTNHERMWYSIAKRANKQYVMFLHGDDTTPNFQKKNPLPGMLTRRLVLGAYWTFFNSTYSLVAVERAVGGLGGKASAVGCGFQIEHIVEASDRKEAKRKVGWGDELVLISVCRLEKRKGVDTTIQALPAVIREFPDCRYVVAGDGPARMELESLAARLGLGDRVSFLGRIDEPFKRALYMAADLYVMPSRPGAMGEVEGFGISLLEANAHGLAVVSSRAGGITDAVTDGENGLLVRPNDSGQLATAICRLLADPDRRREMSTKGQERIRNHFNWQRIVDQVEKKLVEVVGSTTQDNVSEGGRRS